MGTRSGLHGSIVNISVRISIEEYDRIKEAYRRTACRTFSKYLRAMMLCEPVVGRYRSQSIDDFMPVAIGLKNSLDVSVRTIGDFIKALEGRAMSADIGSLIDHLLAEEFSLRRFVEEIRSQLIKITEQ
jgi:hypothetical protein